MGPVVLTKARESQRRHVAAIASDAGVNIKDCYQCGKCTAGCPVAAEADMGPRQLIRNMQLGLLEPIMKSTLPWLCVNCGVCLARCPQNVDMPSLNEAVCRYAMTHGRVVVREGERFMNVFLDNVQSGGVSNETLLAMRFNMETGHLFQDVPNAPKMLTRGLLGGDGYKPQGARDVGRIVKECRRAQNAAAAPKTGGDAAQSGRGEGRETHEGSEA